MLPPHLCGTTSLWLSAAAVQAQSLFVIEVLRYFTRVLIHMYAVARLDIIYIIPLSEHFNAKDEVMQLERRMRIRSSLTIAVK